MAGKSTCRLRARSSSFMSRKRARVRPCVVDDGVEGVQPLVGLGRIDVGDLVGDAVEEH